MRRLVLIVCILGQIGVLAWLVYGRETLIRSGDRLVVRTAPIDPRDPFRGDFVRLSYAFNRGDSTEVLDIDDHRMLKDGRTIHAILTSGPGDVYEFSHFSLERPVEPNFLKGTIRNAWRTSENRTTFQADFNIEKLFVEQGRGLDIEARRGARGELQTAMQVTLAVNDRGDTALVGYDWSPLAIGMRLIEPEPPANAGADSVDPPPLSPATRVFDMLATIENTSNDPLRIVDSPDQCHFMLLQRRADAAQTGNRFSPLDPACNEINETDIITLAPGDTHQIRIRADDPRWQMRMIDATGSQQTGSLRDIAPATLFRLVYTPPAPETLPQGLSVWQGRLLSQAFSIRGVID